MIYSELKLSLLFKSNSKDTLEDGGERISWGDIWVDMFVSGLIQRNIKNTKALSFKENKGTKVELWFLAFKARSEVWAAKREGT